MTDLGSSGEHSKKVTAKKLSWLNRRFVFIAIAIVLLVVAIGGGVAYSRYQSDKRKQQAQAELLKKDQEAYTAAIKQVTEFRSMRRYDDAISAGRSYVSAGKNNENIALMYATMGSVFEEKGDQNSALSAYRQAEKLTSKQLLGVYVGIARASYKNGDKATAVDYYKRALAVMKAKASKTNAMDIYSMEKMIERIEAEK